LEIKKEVAGAPSASTPVPKRQRIGSSPFGRVGGHGKKEGAEVQIETLEEQYGREFDMKYSIWRNLLVPFKELLPDISPDTSGGYDPGDLVLVDYSKVIHWFEGQNTQHQLGFFPLLAKQDLADNLSSSFVERVNSAAKLIMGNSRRPACMRTSSGSWLFSASTASLLSSSGHGLKQRSRNPTLPCSRCRANEI
jgi:hypothetical protein